MAALPTLYPTGDAQVGTWTTDSGGTTNLWQKIEEGISGATDTTDFIRAPTGATNTTANQYEANFTDTPSDFAGMNSLSVNVRYNQTGRSDDTLSLVIRIESSGGTAYTNNLTISNITTTTFTNSGATAFTLTSAGLAATKSDWDSAYIALSQTYSASMGSDNARVQVSAIELTGDYALPTGATATPSTISATATLPAPTETVGETVATATITATTTLPSTTQSAGGSASPTTISATTDIPAATAAYVPPTSEPTLGVGALGTSAIGLTEPATGTDATATPATITATTTLPAVTATGTQTMVGVWGIDAMILPA